VFGDAATPSLVLLTFVIAAPLYVAGYHAGLRPLAGFALSLLLGAVLLAIAVVWPDRSRPRGRRLWEAIHLALRHAGVVLAAFALIVAGAVWIWERTVGPALPWPVVELVTNVAGFAVKPLVHVVLGSLLAFIAAPAVFLGIADADDDQPLHESVDERCETPRQSVLPLHGLLGLWGVWLVLAHVPGLGLLLVPVLGAALRMYVREARAALHDDRGRQDGGPDAT
jgi:hypothetical protein